MCYAKLTLRCDLNGMRVRINDEFDMACTGAPLSLPPGPYTIEAAGWGLTRIYNTTLGPGKEAALDLSLGITAQQASARGFVFAAAAALKNNDGKMARDNLLKAESMDPTWWRPLSMLGDLAEQEGRLEEAAAFYKRAIKSSPDDALTGLKGSLERVNKRLEASKAQEARQLDEDERRREAELAAEASRDANKAGRPDESKAWTTGSIVLTILGAGGVLTGLGFLSAVSNQNDEISALAAKRFEGADDADRADQLIEEGEALETAALAAFGLGIGLLVGAAIVQATSDDDDRAARVNWSIALGEESAGVVLEWSH